MEKYPRFNANDTEQLFWVYATLQELDEAGYIPTTDAGSVDIVWRKAR